MFNATDEVVNCKKNHVFHTKCYEEMPHSEDDDSDTLAMRNLCPTSN